MRVLIVGGGGREHAIGLMISRSSMEPRIYIASPHLNPGLERLAETTNGGISIVDVNNPSDVGRVAESVSPDLVVIGPEEPQFSGVVDYLLEKGFIVFGATSRLAEIERSKVFARELMWKYNIPGRLVYRAFKDLESASEYMEMAGDVVVKPARQAGGKGVKVFQDLQAYLAKDRSRVKKEYVEKLYKEIMSGYSDIEYKILVEQRVEGVEYTVMTITDGSTVVPLPAIEDYPHAFSLDLGPETGGMGSIAGPGWVPPFLEIQEYKESIEIVKKSIEALQREVGAVYRGAIAGQMMLTSIWGPTLIEFYSRFGDPEISCMLPLIQSDFLDLLDRAARGKLAGAALRVREDTAVVVKAVAPAGYPLNKKVAKNHPVAVDEDKIRSLGCSLLYASVERRGNTIYTKGSRAFEIVCSGDTLEKASSKAELAVSHIKSLDGWPLFHRSDIGTTSSVNVRIKLAEKMRLAYKYRREKGLLGTTVVWVPGRGVFSDPLRNPLLASERRVQKS